MVGLLVPVPLPACPGWLAGWSLSVAPLLARFLGRFLLFGWPVDWPAALLCFAGLSRLVARLVAVCWPVGPGCLASLSGFVGRVMELSMKIAYNGDDGDGAGTGTGKKNGDDDTASENVDGVDGGCVDDDVGDGDD